MALYFTNVSEMSNYGAEPTIEFEDMEFEEVIVGYAKKAGIDLMDVGVAGMEEALADYGETEALEGSASATRWGYSKVVSFFCFLLVRCEGGGD